MRRSFLPIVFFVLCFTSLHAERPWRFAVSGDSRNCGDVVMPAIAAGAMQHHAAFYWHLGDFRANYDFDQDYKQLRLQHPATISTYLSDAWQDFIDRQLAPFGSMTVYLGIGNHELIYPKTRDGFIAQFADWLDAPSIRRQRLADDGSDHLVKTYYHWVHEGIDFINLDNGTPDQFDSHQSKWADEVLARDQGDAKIHAVVVGMHQALPGSLASSHSMDDAPASQASGRKLYDRLLELHHESHKPVYVLASHSHFFMAGIFNTEANRNRDGVLPGWIVGTAGAQRYPLPPDANKAMAAETNVYGYLLATVHNSNIDFEFQHLEEKDVPSPVVDRFTSDFIHGCFVGNTSAK